MKMIRLNFMTNRRVPLNISTDARRMKVSLSLSSRSEDVITAIASRDRLINVMASRWRSRAMNSSMNAIHEARRYR